ncbi:hypothetical protein GS504_01910 [Rhodococcus hoagii]|nr:hypothetical protein [Prescottella equi]NKS56370.1 hypothetical protein [Prescottella equi]NKS72219.1 hypothetical protein [Prescottella equi]
MLHNGVIDFETDLRTEHVHVRIYQGVDGAGPVVLLSPLRGDRVHLADRQVDAIRASVNQISPVELEFTEHPCVWFLLVSGRSYSSAWSEEIQAPRVEVTDVSPGIRQQQKVHPSAEYARRRDATAADVARLVGRPFDVFPEELYTPDAVESRVPYADTAAATGVETDERGLSCLIGELTTVLNHLDEHPSYGFAAQVLADQALHRHREIVKSQQFLERQIASGSRSLDTESYTRLAVHPQPRRLNLAELQLVQQHQPTTPIVGEYAEASPFDTVFAYTVHPDTTAWHGTITAFLDATFGPDHTTKPEYQALVHAQEILSEALASADPDHRDRYWRPSSGQVMLTLGHPVLTSYLATLRRVDDSTPLQPGDRRRLADLTGHAHGATVAQYHDDANDLYIIEVVNERSSDYPNQLLAEWPRRRLDPAVLEASDARIIAPDTTVGVYRPVFITTGGTWIPVPTGSRGFVWGVSSTDSLTPAILGILSLCSRLSPLNDAEREFESTFDASLRRLLTSNGTGDLDIPASDVISIYNAYRDAISEPIEEDPADPFAQIAAESGWRRRRDSDLLVDANLAAITYPQGSYRCASPREAMRQLGWITEDDTVDHTRLPAGSHARAITLRGQIRNS